MAATPDQWDMPNPPLCGARFNATRYFPRFYKKLDGNSNSGLGRPKFKRTNERIRALFLKERAKGVRSIVQTTLRKKSPLQD